MVWSSETVSTRLPPELVRLMIRDAEAKVISLSVLLREIAEEHYGVKLGKPVEKSFILQPQEADRSLN